MSGFNVPLVVAEKGQELPPLGQGQTRYVMSKRGILVQRDTPLFTSSVLGKVQLGHLEDLNETVTLHVPKLPAIMLAQAIGFFQAVYHKHDGEGALVLLYDPEKREFQWYCPTQESSWDVHFETPTDFPPNLIIFGDIHSHPDSVAVPSHIDTSDEHKSDGMHIIIGRVVPPKWRGGWKGQPDRTDYLHYHVDFCVDSARFTFKPEDVFETVLTEYDGPFPEPPEEWMAKVTKKKPWYSEYGDHTRRFFDDGESAYGTSSEARRGDDELGPLSYTGSRMPSVGDFGHDRHSVGSGGSGSGTNPSDQFDRGLVTDSEAELEEWNDMMKSDLDEQRKLDENERRANERRKRRKHKR